MKKLSSLLFLAASIVLAPPVGAQFLDKLNKGLKKVNNALEKIDKATKGNKDNTPQKSNAQGNVPQSHDANWTKVESSGTVPFITEETKFMHLDDLYGETFSNVEEGIFWVKKEKHFEFWTVDGKKLFGNDWDAVDYSNSNPAFHGGVAVVRRAKSNATGQRPVCLLYRNGAVRELDPAYKSVTQFCDGLAMVKQMVNGKEKSFFINPRGEKVFPALPLYWDQGEVRPLNDGLRAVATAPGKWGYIDANGKIVLEAKYCEARDFHEGYAWVGVGDHPQLAGNVKYHLIDTKGNVLLTVDRPNSPRELSDVSEGIFYQEKNSDIFYYDVKGKELGHYDGGNMFYGGHAFVVPLNQTATGENGTALINRDFKVVKQISERIVPGEIPEDNQPVFNPYGLGTVNHINSSYILTPDARVRVRSYENDQTDTSIKSFGQLSASGYAMVKEMKIRNVQYRALMRADGRIEWLFSEEGDGKKDMNLLPTPTRGNPEHSGPNAPTTDTKHGQPDPPSIQIIENVPPIGPTKVIEKTYKVTLTHSEGGTASLSATGPFKYGDIVSVSATPNEDWALGSIVITGDAAKDLDGHKPMAVTSDLDIRVNFIKKPEISAPEIPGTYQGLKQYYFDYKTPTPIDIYAEISDKPDISSPYGNQTYGFLVLMIDPKVRRMGKGMSCYIFGMPLKISGYQHEASGDEWLICDGGTLAGHDIRMETKNPMERLFYKFIMTVDGTESIQGIPRSYRIHIDKRDKDTHEITLGRLEVFSIMAGGWVPGGDESVENRKEGIFVSTIEKGWPADTYQGIVLKPASKRNDVEWYTPKEWYSNPNIYQAIMESMRNSYGSFQTDIEALFKN